MQLEAIIIEVPILLPPFFELLGEQAAASGQPGNQSRAALLHVFKSPASGRMENKGRARGATKETCPSLGPTEAILSATHTLVEGHAFLPPTPSPSVFHLSPFRLVSLCQHGAP